jgi:hypothetical protein
MKNLPTKKLEKLATAVEKRLKLHHTLYSLPVIAEQWEEILVKSLEEIGERADWDTGSHKVGEDIATDTFGRISCKSGTLKCPKQGPNAGVETLTISGSRTTGQKTLKEKIKYLSQSHDDYYFTLPKYMKDMKSGTYRYWMAIFPSKLIKPNKLGWKKKGKDFCAEGRGIKQSISTSMSSQLWTTIETHKVPYWYELNA